MVKIVDRKKDMVLVSGFNVYPNEVEDVIAMHPGVLECAVIGVPDAASGEAVKAFVVQDAIPALTEDELKHSSPSSSPTTSGRNSSNSATSCRRRNVGKILRRALRDEPAKQKAA